MKSLANNFPKLKKLKILVQRDVEESIVELLNANKELESLSLSSFTSVKFSEKSLPSVDTMNVFDTQVSLVNGRTFVGKLGHFLEEL
jgi:hypothetical protein